MFDQKRIGLLCLLMMNVAFSETIPVHFKPGTSQAVFSNHLQGWTEHHYVLRVRRGQIMKAFLPLGLILCCILQW